VGGCCSDDRFNVTTDPQDQLYCPLPNSECVDALRAVVARTPDVARIDAGPIATVDLSGEGRSARLHLFLFSSLARTSLQPTIIV
jgi:hypothetical protein